MLDYTPIENALVERLIEHFPDDLNAGRCNRYLDRVLDNIFDENAKYGVVLEFGGGNEDNTTFNSLGFTWRIEGIFFIRFTDMVTVEDDLRRIVSRLATLLEPPYHKLNNTTPRAWITSISRPTPENIIDTPFYFLPFGVAAFVK